MPTNYVQISKILKIVILLQCKKVDRFALIATTLKKVLKDYVLSLPLIFHFSAT